MAAILEQDVLAMVYCDLKEPIHVTVYFLNVAFYYFAPSFLYAKVFLSSMCLIMLNIFHLVFCFLFSF